MPNRFALSCGGINIFDRYPLKVIHIVENLNRGAVENWLVRMLRHARHRSEPVDWTFYCTLGEPGQLDEQALELGAKIVYSQVPLARKLAFCRQLRDTLRTGQYDVLHAHHDLISGLYLAASANLPIKKRFVHVHNADESILTPNLLKQTIFRPILRRICLGMADGIIGISQHTLDTFLAGRPRQPGRDRVHYYGIEPAPFLKAAIDREGFRRELDLPADARILLFAGRIVPEKNPLFAVDVFAAMRRKDPRVCAVFAGAGSLDEAVRQRAAEHGVAEGLRMPGWRDDVPRVMVNADWFILPRPEHPREGLGIAVVEAQLAGLRLLLSEGIADDPLLPGSVWNRLPLAAGPAEWAERALTISSHFAPTPKEAADVLRTTLFDLDSACKDLEELYLSATQGN